MAPKGSESMNQLPSQDNATAPPIIDLSEEMRQEDTKQEEEKGFFHSAAEFIIISISGCAPKRQKR